MGLNLATAFCFISLLCDFGLHDVGATDFNESILLSSKSTRVSLGEDVRLRCTVRINNFQNIAWLREDEACVSSSVWCNVSETVEYKNNTAISEMVVMNIQKNHTYSCVASGHGRFRRASTFIEVGKKPELFGNCRIEPEDPQPRGRKVIVTCTYRSESDSSRRWLDGDDVLNDTIVMLFSDGKLVSSMVEMNPILRRRLLQFRVENSFGVLQKVVTVQVVDRHLNDECENGQDCVTPQAVCRTNLCECPSALPVRDNTAIPSSCLPVSNFGKSCRISEQCEASDNHTTCVSRQCTCLPGYAKDRDRCLATPDRDLYVILGVGLAQVFLVGAMLGLYFYRKRNEETFHEKMAEENGNLHEMKNFATDQHKF